MRWMKRANRTESDGGSYSIYDIAPISITSIDRAVGGVGDTIRMFFSFFLFFFLFCFYSLERLNDQNDRLLNWKMNEGLISASMMEKDGLSLASIASLSEGGREKLFFLKILQQTIACTFMLRPSITYQGHPRSLNHLQKAACSARSNTSSWYSYSLCSDTLRAVSLSHSVRTVVYALFWKKLIHIENKLN